MKKTRNTTATWLENYNRWQIKVTNEDGVRKTFTCPTPGRKGQTECNRKADEWLEKGNRDPNLRCDKAIDQWLEDVKAVSKQKNLRGEEVYSENYLKLESVSRVRIKPVIGSCKVSKLSNDLLQDVIDSAFSDGLAKKSLQNIRGVLSNWLKYCRKKDWTKLSTEEISIPESAPTSEKQILQPDDLGKLFSIDTTSYCGKTVPEWYINVWRLAVVLGYRPGELLALERKHISGDVLMVRGSINSRNIKTSGKNENAIRDTVLPQIAQEIINNQLVLLRAAGVVSKYLFPSKDGSAAKQVSVRDNWGKYCRANGIAPVSPYELRHTYVSICSGRTNVTLGELKALVGHSRNMDTLGTYGHKIKDTDRRTAAIINDAFMDIIK